MADARASARPWFRGDVAVSSSAAGEHHVVCGATPAGFGAPVYVQDPDAQPNDVLRSLLQHSPRLPRGLKSAGRLKASGLRASNLFRPDAYFSGLPG
ncbi:MULTISPECIES: hypothetical protein [Streptomyces]|uniref:hypothetical protein n=1 Tax=Streptomyces TaxID=1883 RepID=UPI0016741464|nr:hypothetical protein [Streptomyces canarius]